MATESEVVIPIPPTLKEKLIFYTTTFFLLLGIFSAFGFLFLVPFIIEPAYTTIKMDFDEEPAHCTTASILTRRGLSNCTWTSCREGCTREVYECTQILVNYMHPNIPNSIVLHNTNVEEQTENHPSGSGSATISRGDGDYTDVNGKTSGGGSRLEYDEDLMMFEENQRSLSYASASGADDGGATKYKWFYGARLFPNVKGCGYPPYLNCTVFNNTYVRRGSNFSCYYSRADPSLVVSELDMRQVHVNLICAIAVPIVSFILSAIYLTFAYFFIYHDDASKASEKSTPCRRKLTAQTAAPIVQITPLALSTPLAPPPTSGILTPSSEMFHEDVDSIGYQYKYAMVDDMLSRESLDSLAFNYSSSMNGNLNKMMTTCILTPPGPIAQL
ncbi:hypothetical protein V9T40_010715 [Parthenolecanium corni]|uniref:Protein tipE n=1 Tax=Parthenolecanium corni TaxID=536013 RepID=A0AAN9XXW5_9HEMI